MKKIGLLIIPFLFLGLISCSRKENVDNNTNISDNTDSSQNNNSDTSKSDNTDTDNTSGSDAGKSDSTDKDNTSGSDTGKSDNTDKDNTSGSDTGKSDSTDKDNTSGSDTDKSDNTDKDESTDNTNDTKEYAILNAYNYNNDSLATTIKVDINDLNVSVKSFSGYSFTGIYNEKSHTSYFDFSNIKKDKTYNVYFDYQKNQTSNNASVISYVDDLISNTTSYIPKWNAEGFKGRFNYIDGVFLKSMIDLYNNTTNKKYMDFVVKYVNYYIDSTGTFIYYKDKKSSEGEANNSKGFKSGELDTICECQVLFDLYDYTKDSRYINAIEYAYSQLNNMTRCSGTSNFNHKETYKNQIWLDSMYMYAPFLTRYASYKNDDSIFDLIKEQYTYLIDNMKDESGLYVHGYDTTKTIFWCDENGKSKNVWLRSLGWLAASLCDVYTYTRSQDRDFYKNILKDLLDNLKKYRDTTTNMYYQLPTLGNQTFMVDNFYLKNNDSYGDIKTIVPNYLESSGSSLIAYATLSYANISGDETYLTDGKAIFDGVYNKSFSSSGLKDICIQSGLGPETNTYRDGSVSYYLSEDKGENDAKGLGPFLMAYTKYIK